MNAEGLQGAPKPSEGLLGSVAEGRPGKVPIVSESHASSFDDPKLTSWGQVWWEINPLARQEKIDGFVQNPTARLVSVETHRVSAKFLQISRHEELFDVSFDQKRA